MRLQSLPDCFQMLHEGYREALHFFWGAKDILASREYGRYNIRSRNSALRKVRKGLLSDEKVPAQKLFHADCLRRRDSMTGSMNAAGKKPEAPKEAERLKRNRKT